MNWPFRMYKRTKAVCCLISIKEITETYTLQTDPQYFLFWIHIGQGNSKEALDIARVLGDDRYIFTALVAYRNEIQNDDSLSAEENKTARSDH